MNANYMVEFEQYYEIVKPFGVWSKVNDKYCYRKLPIGTIIKGKDLFPEHFENPDWLSVEFVKYMLSTYAGVPYFPNHVASDVYFRPLPHQIFF